MGRRTRTAKPQLRPEQLYAWEVDEPPVTEDDLAFYDFFENVLMSLSAETRDDSLDLGERGRRLWHARGIGRRR